MSGTLFGFSACFVRTGFWLRVPTGHGVSVRWDNPRPLFSERAGRRRVYRWGRVAVQVLGREARGVAGGAP